MVQNTRSLPDCEIAAKHWLRFSLLACILLATALRLGMLDAKDLWIDEAFSHWITAHPTRTLVATAAELDHHPPLYYLLLQAWRIGAGDSEYALRFLSAWLGVASVPLFFRVGRALVGSWTALTATLLLSVAPFHIAYAQEARMYTLLGVCALLTLHLALRLLAARCAPPFLWYGPALAAAQALTMLSHNSAAVLFPLALNLWAWTVWRLRSRDPNPADTHRLPSGLVRFWLGAQALAVLFWSPWLPAFLRQAREVDQRFWVDPPSGDRIWFAIQTVTSGHPPDWWLLRDSMVALSLVLVLVGIAALRARPEPLAALVLLWAAAPIVALVLSLRRPIFLESTLIWTTFPLYLLLACGLVACLTQLPQRITPFVRRALFAGVTAAVIGGMIGGLWGHYTGGAKEEWQTATQSILQQAQPADLILFHASWTQLPFAYYADRSAHQREAKITGTGEATSTQRNNWRDHVRLGGVPENLFQRGELEPLMRPADVPELRQRIAHEDRVWLVYSHAAYSDPRQRVLSTLHTEFEATLIRHFSGIEIYLFERNGFSQPKWDDDHQEP